MSTSDAEESRFDMGTLFFVAGRGRRGAGRQRRLKWPIRGFAGGVNDQKSCSIGPGRRHGGCIECGGGCMDLVMTLLVGGLIGWLASLLMKTDGQ